MWMHVVTTSQLPPGESSIQDLNNKRCDAAQSVKQVNFTAICKSYYHSYYYHYCYCYYAN